MIRARRKLLTGMAACLLVLGALFWLRGAEATWRLWGVLLPPRSYFDLRALTAGAQSYREGFDPMYRNPHDFAGRVVNYPRAWQLLYRLGLEERHTTWLAEISIGIFLLTFFLATPPVAGWGRVAGLLLAVFSPAIALCCERGNTDLVVFALLALAVMTEGTVWSFLAVMSAFVLKLFPLAALVVVLRHELPVARRYLLAGAGLAALYLLCTLADLRQIVATTPRDWWLSYGRVVITLRAQAAGWPMANLLGPALNIAVLGWLAFTLGRWWRQAGAAPPGMNPSGLAGFRVGAACYVGTFLVGTNYDYKLLFLLLAVPQLQAWAKDERTGFKAWARVALAALYYSMWRMLIDPLLAAAGLGEPVAFAVGETAHWMLFGALSFLLAGTLPAWLRGRGGETRPHDTGMLSTN